MFPNRNSCPLGKIDCCPYENYRTAKGLDSPPRASKNPIPHNAVIYPCNIFMGFPATTSPVLTLLGLPVIMFHRNTKVSTSNIAGMSIQQVPVDATSVTLRFWIRRNMFLPGSVLISRTHLRHSRSSQWKRSGLPTKNCTKTTGQCTPMFTGDHTPHSMTFPQRKSSGSTMTGMTNCGPGGG